MSKFIEQIVNEQIRKSQLASQKRIENGSTCKTTIITISRTMGSGARIVAQKVATDLGLSMWGKELLDYIIQEGDVSQRVAETFDEKAISEFEVFARAAFGDTELGSFIYPKHLSHAIHAIAKLGNAIILGRGANFLLPDALHIRIDASFGFRVKNMITFEGLSESQAEAKIRLSDKERLHYLAQTFGKEKVANAEYDITLWMDRFSNDGAAEIIKAAIVDRCRHFKELQKSETDNRVKVALGI